MADLILYEKYDREEVHDILDPNSSFTKQAGTWGLQGIVSISSKVGDYVFFVTYGKKQGEHVFDEGITEDGILTWQTQPKMGLENTHVKRFIEHDSSKNNIYLFLRDKPEAQYTYLGQLKYMSHDNERENPVYFKWKILNWNLDRAMECLSELKCMPKNYLSSRRLKITEISEEEKINEIEDDKLLLEICSENISNITYSNMPKPKENTIKIGSKEMYPRNKYVAQKALSLAMHECEFNKNHETFKRRNSSFNYTEPHHLVPMAYFSDFDVSLDVEENIVSLCSNCHNLIHYGEDAKIILEKLFIERENMLKAVGINITLEELFEMYKLNG